MVDFVILWVDGKDPAWVQEYVKYATGETGEAKVQFRDWDNLQYIFRAFEHFAPWVRKIHFITYGHLPKWLNVEHPKLNIVQHTDILDADHLPVFNSNAIELNICQIKDLAEKFVLFNDDLFLTAPVAQTRFFKDGLPRDMLVCNALSSSSGVGHFILNNLEILNRYMNKPTSIKKNIGKWFHHTYGLNIIRNLALLPWKRFTGFVDPHMPQPFLKSTLDELWEKEPEILAETSASKFRSCKDVNQYLFRYWQLAKGNFVPVSMNDTKYITMKMDSLKSGEVSEMIISSQYSMICLNDHKSIQTDEEFEAAKIIVKEAFAKILPKKSAFEL